MQYAPGSQHSGETENPAAVQSMELDAEGQNVLECSVHVGRKEAGV